MSRANRGDDVERDAHRSRQQHVADELPLFGGALAGDEPLPDATPLAQLSDRDWLAGAQQRVDSLTPVDMLKDATELAHQTIRDLSMQPPWHSVVEAGDTVLLRPPGQSGPAAIVQKASKRSERAQKRAAKGLGAVLKKNAPKGMARDRDHATSLDAALAVEPHLSTMQQNVLDAFTRYGAMTDETLERLPEFSQFKYSTARKRRTELVAMGKLASCGKALNGSGSARMTLWDLAERVKPEQCAHDSSAETDA